MLIMMATVIMILNKPPQQSQTTTHRTTTNIRINITVNISIAINAINPKHPDDHGHVPCEQFRSFQLNLNSFWNGPSQASTCYLFSVFLSTVKFHKKMWKMIQIYWILIKWFIFHPLFYITFIAIKFGTNVNSSYLLLNNIFLHGIFLLHLCSPLGVGNCK